MGIRMRLHDGEPIGKALRRFKKLVEQLRAAGFHGKRHKPKPWLRESPYFVRNNDIRRYKDHRKLRKAQAATLAAKRAGEQ
jgi:ribosomal protein S21